MRRLMITILLLVILPSALANSPVATKGRHFMAVSAQHYASEVGKAILQAGGNAIDAAVAMGYALAVVNPAAGNLGGGGFMLIRFANGQTTFLNFREKAPLKATPKAFLDNKGNVIKSYLSGGHIRGTLTKPYMGVAVPGTVMGLNTALQRYGTMSLHEVIAPAIQLAEKGFTLMPGDVAVLKTGEDSFRTQQNVAAIFLKKGKSYSPGDCLIQKHLATTLKEIAGKGTKVFYEGRIAKQIVSASNKNGGLLTLADFKNYTVEEMRPLKCNYRGYQIITTPPPGSGATICEALKILEPYPLKKWHFHSPPATHYIVEAMRFSYADRNRYLADPDFTPNPTRYLLSSSYIHTLTQKIKPNKATPSRQIGFLPNEGGNTTSYVVIDREGTAVSVTYTLNDYFGAKVIPGKTGFFLNNEMADFTISPEKPNIYGLYQGKQNLVAPGKRPLSSMAPTILTKNKQLFMLIGTPGGSTIPSQLIDVIINVVDYRMNIMAAENAPRFHMQWLPDLIYMEPGAFSPNTIKILQRMGYHFHLGSPYDTKQWGAVSGILVKPNTKIIEGAMDNRRPSGSAAGE
jgi:gamma-glutamyltranspeptidase / glutathione hydrolase